MEKQRLLIVNDQIDQSLTLKVKLKSLGIKNITIANSYGDASAIMNKEDFDIYFLDYFLDRDKTAIDLVTKHSSILQEPIIFCNTTFERRILEQIRSFKNMNFMFRDDTIFELEKTIRTVMHRISEVKIDDHQKDFFLVKIGRDLIKINVRNFEYIEVDAKYLCIYIRDEKYLIRSTLASLSAKLPSNFIRIHSSTIINIDYLERINLELNTVHINNKILSISRKHKKHLIDNYYNP